jgi:hypothetical protein
MPRLRFYPFEVIATCRQCRAMFTLSLVGPAMIEPDSQVVRKKEVLYHRCGGEIKLFKWSPKNF